MKTDNIMTAYEYQLMHGDRVKFLLENIKV